MEVFTVIGFVVTTVALTGLWVCNSLQDKINKTTIEWMKLIGKQIDDINDELRKQ